MFKWLKRFFYRVTNTCEVCEQTGWHPIGCPNLKGPDGMNS